MQKVKPELLLVDDDPFIIESLSIILQPDFELYTADARGSAREKLRQLGHVPSLALVDLGLPPLPANPDEGFELISELLSLNTDMKILVLSGQSEKANIQHALTLGAVDFIPKPCDMTLLQSRLNHQIMMLEAEAAREGSDGAGEQLLGESPAITTLQALITQFASTPFAVLIAGESGSGRELVARSIHARSPRARAPFLVINCAAFTAELLEAQLFGHARGAFTGATTARRGFFAEASEGSLFLDEIGELPLALQSKLLRVLENGEYYRLGETQARASAARIVAATNRDLKADIQTGRFRQDLYHRLGVLTLNVPPLRERDGDCLVLLAHFRQIYAVAGKTFALDESAVEALLAYDFPGNVRELRNIVIRLGAKYPNRTVSQAQLKAELESIVPAVAPGGAEVALADVEQQLMATGFRLEEKLNAWRHAISPPHYAQAVAI